MAVRPGPAACRTDDMLLSAAHAAMCNAAVLATRLVQDRQVQAHTTKYSAIGCNWPPCEQICRCQSVLSAAQDGHLFFQGSSTSSRHCRPRRSWLSRSSSSDERPDVLQIRFRRSCLTSDAILSSSRCMAHAHAASCGSLLRYLHALADMYQPWD